MKRELLSILIAALILLLVALAASAQSVKISDMPAATDPTGTELVPVVQGGANRKMSISQWQNLFPLLSGSYSNPSWLNSLAWSKITGTPTTLSGYGITGAETLQSLRVNGTAGAGFLQMDWQSANPTGAASRTTLWADNSGRLNWRLGTGGSSFIRTFDATGITADRTYTLPDFSGTLLAIGTNALGANNVNLLNGNLLVGPTGATITDNTRLDVRGTGTTSSTFGLRVANSANVTRLTLNDEGTLNLATTATTHTWIGSSYQGWSSLVGAGGGANIQVGQIISIAGATNSFRFDLSSIPTGGAAMEIRETTSDTNIGGANSGAFILTKGGFTRNSGTNTHTHLQLNPTYNTTASYSGTINGIDYNPTLTSLTGATHIAWRNTSGSMLIGGTSLTNANTIFDIQSTTQGVALPRMTDTQRNAIGSPYSGLQIHSTTSNRPNWHNGTVWQETASRGDLNGWLTGSLNSNTSIDYSGYEITFNGGDGLGGGGRFRVFNQEAVEEVFFGEAGNVGQGGLKYGNDYSANYTDRSLVDRGYVLSAKTFTGRQTFATGNNGSLVVGTNTVDDSSPVNGLIMYNTTSNTFRFRQNGAWVGLGAGGGITNSAVSNELMVSNGTNAIGRKLFSAANGDITLGDNTLVAGSTRSIVTDGSAGAVPLLLSPKGGASIGLQTTTLNLGDSTFAGDRTISASNNLFNANLHLNSENQVVINNWLFFNTVSKLVLISGGSLNSFTGIILSANREIYSSSNLAVGQNLTIRSGNAQSGNNNGGDLYLSYGNKAGSGLDGNIGLLTTSVTWQSMERGLYIANVLTAPTGNPTGGIFTYINAGNWQWRSPSGSIYSLKNEKIITVIAGESGVVTTGTKVRTIIISPYAGRIVRWKALADVSTTATLRVRKNGVDITGSVQPSLSASRTNNGFTLTGWDTTVVENDYFELEVSSNTAANHIGVELVVEVTS